MSNCVAKEAVSVTCAPFRAGSKHGLPEPFHGLQASRLAKRGYLPECTTLALTQHGSGHQHFSEDLETFSPTGAQAALQLTGLQNDPV